MNENEIRTCVNCGLELFEFKEEERISNYENMKESIPHSRLRCEINQIISKRIQELRIEINQIKERMNL